MAHTSTQKTVVNVTKRVVDFHKHIARVLEDNGHDVHQVELACQSAINDVSGIMGDAKITSVKHSNKAKTHAKWRETLPVSYECKAGNAFDFLAWHDALSEVWEKHGEPHGEITFEIVPASLVVWLAGMMKRKAEKAAKGKDRPVAKENGPADRVNAPAVA